MFSLAEILMQPKHICVPVCVLVICVVVLYPEMRRELIATFTLCKNTLLNLVELLFGSNHQFSVTWCQNTPIQKCMTRH